jgi:hypothetical protein
MSRVIGYIFGVVILVAFFYPFARDAYRRYEVEHRLNQVMTDRDKEAFQAWNGSPEAFGRSLYTRCELANGPNSPICDPYRRAIE